MGKSENMIQVYNYGLVIKNKTGGYYTGFSNTFDKELRNAKIFVSDKHVADAIARLKMRYDIDTEYIGVKIETAPLEKVFNNLTQRKYEQNMARRKNKD